MSALKDAARQMIENLPEDATWEDLEYQLYVRRKVERGLKDAVDGKVLTHEEVRRKLGTLLRP